MTYRFDSDIPWFYGRIIDKSTNRSVALSNAKWKEPEINFYGKKL